MSARSLARMRRRIGDAAAYAALLLACGFVLLPILWALSTSLKLPQEIHAGAHWWPESLTLRNYLGGALGPKFLRYIGNSLLVAAATLVVSVALAVHAAYAVARRRFFGKDVLLFLIWATIMIPGVSVVVPLYMLSVDVGLYDTYAVLVIVYAAWLIPTLIWLLRSFVAAIPPSLEEAALVDGCTPLRAFYLVVLPLLRPGLGAAAVLVFVTIWNDFLIGFALTLSDEHRLLQVGLQAFVTEGGIDWGPMMAATIFALLPAGLLFAFLQRAFIQGVTGGAVKG
ncbi:MAG TPA: carbohydrate ABC transporter permease [Acetobacteraceae bacterium]